ncbi:UDP-N-acetylmuramate--L-alanine ligase [Salinimicrobium catena]|uniref:UDP-N-acetylmuramate--L-alanine ligase n=1 Tax=Salinimicrobium catena TaxID=390640 RepID=A0A1H5P1V0_9FLAO|nr:UDP-N-acetylmuramate--L-alanine ligase [Salinimicrobium catena]SDL63949.1 UDP-N-acetylmuramate--L-alanine ligase [Salinimicrobium catena]SEF06958.1 UDP-N-acetylmuramate--L-alanine ligase [Salinimicrobium catena]
MGHYDNIRNIYFIGIGGIGMSALARYFHALDYNVSGYDRSSSDLVNQLRAEGIEVINSSKVEDLPEAILEDKESLIVYTPAIPKEHPQYLHFVADSYQMEKRAEVLGKLTKGHFTLAVAGTHGKTTTSTMLAHLLKATGAEVTAFLGGISENYDSNLIMSGDKVMVVEADEFDRSFLQLAPNIAAITSMDADHLDIYGEDSQIKDSFRAFAALVPEDGKLFFANGLPLKGTSVGVEDDSDVIAQNVQIKNGSYLFDLKTKERTYPGFSLQLPGRHNLQNAVTALAMALEFGAPPELLAGALASFKGVQRRFSYRIRTEELALIDDYAHHPAEITAVHQAIKEMHPGKKVLAVFQPHLFSRTRDFAEEFGRSLSLFDEVLLLDIYPAREEPIEGVTSEWLLEKIENNKKQLVQKEELPQAIKNSDARVVVILGAGDIGEEVERIKKKMAGEN